MASEEQLMVRTALFTADRCILTSRPDLVGFVTNSQGQYGSEGTWRPGPGIQNLDFINIPILEERFQADRILRNQRKPVHGLGPQTQIGNKNVMCINWGKDLLIKHVPCPRLVLTHVKIILNKTVFPVYSKYKSGRREITLFVLSV